jgi:hypothetical protein
MLAELSRGDDPPDPRAGEVSGARATGGLAVRDGVIAREPFGIMVQHGGIRLVNELPASPACR